MKNSRAVGADYEKKAAQYLESLGYRIIARNFSCRQGEIDLIAEDGKYLVFIEVKYRKNQKAGMPQEAVGLRKQRAICRAASFYCLRHGISQEHPCRFDVAAFVDGEWSLIRNAFDYLL